MVQVVNNPLSNTAPRPQRTAYARPGVDLGEVLGAMGDDMLFDGQRTAAPIGQNFDVGASAPAAQRFGASFPQTQASGTDPASVRYNNPGAQYPSSAAAAFGQTGFGIIGGGHKIARFPDPESGVAANLDLLSRNYTGMSIGEAGRKWTGSHSFGIPGYDPNAKLTPEMLNDSATAIALMKAIAYREAGRTSPLTEDQWAAGYRKFRGGR